MEKFITATGKTIDLAIAAALEQLGMDRDSVSVEVLDNPRSGFLGIGAQPARVKVTYEAPDEPPKPALSSASRSKPKKPVQESASAPKVIAPAAPAAPAPAMAQPRPEPKPQQPKPAREPKPRPERKPQQPKAPKAPKAAEQISKPEREHCFQEVPQKRQRTRAQAEYTRNIRRACVSAALPTDVLMKQMTREKDRNADRAEQIPGHGAENIRQSRRHDTDSFQVYSLSIVSHSRPVTMNIW